MPNFKRENSAKPLSSGDNVKSKRQRVVLKPTKQEIILPSPPSSISGSTRKRADILNHETSSVISYGSSSSSSSTVSLNSSNSVHSVDKQKQPYWLPPISSLLSNVDPTFNCYYTPVMQQQPKQEPTSLMNKKKLNSKKKTATATMKKKPTVTMPKKQEPKPVFMPMIPYYFHHRQFGIESCMLQLEGQKKFNNYYYI